MRKMKKIVLIFFIFYFFTIGYNVFGIDVE